MTNNKHSRLGQHQLCLNSTKYLLLELHFIIYCSLVAAQQ